MAEIFKIDFKDYSQHVVAENYKINLEDVVQEWTDGGQVLHKDVVRQRVSGSFKMYFPTEASLQEFLSYLASKKTIRNTYPVSLKVNNSDISNMVNKEVFIDFKPTRKRDARWQDAFEVFDVNIQES